MKFHLRIDGWVWAELSDNSACLISHFGYASPPWVGWEENQKNASEFINTINKYKNKL